MGGVGDFPVTVCPPGFADGAYPLSDVRPKSSRRLFTQEDQSRTAKPLKRLAQAKIALALTDLACRRDKREAEYNKTVARHFLSSEELTFWCDMAVVDEGSVRRRVQEILALSDDKY